MGEPEADGTPTREHPTGSPDATGPQKGGFAGAFATLRMPHFKALLGSTVLQQICGQIMMLGMQWLVLTELNASMQGYMWIGFLQGGVNAILSPYSGVIADRVAKKRLLVVGRLALVAIVSTMAALVATDLVTMTHVYLASVLGGIVSALMQVSSQTYVFDVVGRSSVERAVALTATGTGLAAVGGPAIAAWLLATIGVVGTFVFGGAGLFASAALLLAIPVAGKLVEQSERRSAREDLREGLAWMWRDPPVRLVLIGCTMAFFNGAMAPMRPVFAHHVLDVGELGLGQMGATTGVGLVLAAVALTSMQRFPHPGLWIIGSLWIYSLSMFAYSFAYSLEYVLACEFMIGVSGQVWNVTTIAGLQLAAPEAMRGRVIGVVFTIAVLGFLGHPILGWLADHYGPQIALGGFGAIPSAVLAVLLLFGWRQLARVGSQLPRAQTPAGPDAR